MKTRFAIAYAYPTSTNAEALGFYKTGCYYVEQQVLREDGCWSAPTIAPGAFGTLDKNDPDLIQVLKEYRAG